MEKTPTVQLRSRFNGSLWIYKGMIKAPRSLSVGALVRIESKKKEFVGWGFYNPHTPVALRVLTTEETFPDKDFLYEKLKIAKDLRKDLLPKITSYRLCHGEGDGLTGLIIDVFEKTIVIQPMSAGWLYLMEDLIEALSALYRKAKIVVRSDRKMCEREKISFETLSQKYSGSEVITIQENSLKFYVDLKEGHKTGFFLDQRSNREFVSQLSRNRHVLDLCCYTGGFSLMASRHRAKSVTAVDLDEKALEVAKKNAKINKEVVDFIHQDGFQFLREAQERNKTYNLVIVDPPKFVDNRKNREKGVKKYLDLNRMAMEVTRSGGYFLSCSCSGLVSEEEFLKILFQAARYSKKVLQVVRISGADVDHPYTNVFPEGRYLKAICARVSSC